MSAVRSIGTLAFARGHARTLAFGMLHSFFSAPGQTICVGLFITSFSASFGLGAAEIGGLYLIATVGSALTLLGVGHLIDRVALATYSTLSIAALALACMLTAAASSPLVLCLGLYCLRFAGQGLMIHIEATATARAFSADRGRALGITALGQPLSDAILPSILVAALPLLGWRWTYAAIGLFLLLAVLPVARGLAPRPGAGPITAGTRPSLVAGLSLLAQSRYVWAVLPALAIMPVCGTALLFNVSAIALARGWPTGLVALSFVAMALASVAALIVFGRMIDRFTARRVFVIHALPALAGYTLLALVDRPWALPVALMLLGTSGAIGKTTSTAIWAELFGTANLGAIRSFAAMYMVLASALSPFIWGLLADLGWPVPAILLLFAAGGLLATLPVAIRELRGR